MPDFIITNIRIDTEKHRRLKHIAVDNGVSFTELIRRVIDGFLEGEIEVAPAGSPSQKRNSAKPRVNRDEGGSGDSGRIIIR